MAINVSVQYNVGLLPDIVLLTQCYHHRGTRLNALKRCCLCSLKSHLYVLSFSPLTGGCSEGLDAFRFFFKHACTWFGELAYHNLLGDCITWNSRATTSRGTPN